MARRRSQEERERNARSTWILCMKDGYALWTACTKCGQMAKCRGRHRDSVKCWPCTLATS